MKLDEWQRQVSLESRLRVKRERQKQQAAKEEEARAREEKLRAALEATNKPKPVPWEFTGVINVCPKMGDHLKDYVLFGRTEMGDYAKAVSHLLSFKRLRPLADWKPQGKSATALFRSLGGHLLAKYPLPPFVWSAFFGEPNRRMQFPKMVEHLASGGSLIEYLKTSPTAIKLTRKLCHEFLKSAADLPIVHALRRTQVLGAGGSPRLVQAVIGTSLGMDIHDEPQEAFYQTMFHWFANQPMLDPNQVGPLFDYIRHTRGADADFSMKGRTGLSVIRAMETWHAENARTGMHNYKGVHVFKPSGFQGAEYDFSRRDSSGDDIVEIWRIQEILTAKELAAEGKRQGHCVFSYNRRIESGETSIWVLSKEDSKSRAEHGGVWNMLTLEVRNQLKQVVQARGRFNRSATAHELNMIRRWMATAPYA